MNSCKTRERTKKEEKLGSRRYKSHPETAVTKAPGAELCCGLGASHTEQEDGVLWNEVSRIKAEWQMIT